MSTGKPLTKEEVEREKLAISIYERYSLPEEERPVIETMTYSDKYKKILDGICLDKMKLDGMKKEEEEAIIKVKGEALIEKDDPGAFVIPTRLKGKINVNALVDTSSDINTMPYRIYKELGREDVKKVKREITMLNHSKAEPIGILRDVLYQVGVTTIIAKFLILDMPTDRDTPILVGKGFLHTCGGILDTIERITSTFDGICHQTFRAAQTSLDTAESDHDDEEEYAIKRNKIGAPIYGPKPARYLNCIDPLDRSLALQEHVEWKPDYTRCFIKMEDSDGQWHAEIRLTDPYGNIYDKGCNRDAKSRMGCGKEIDGMLRINLCEVGTNEEIFTYVAWIRAFNINEPIYLELCHKFYLTYEFDEVCADDELQTKRIIKFRLGGHAYSLTLLEFARRLGLYHADELDEEGFDVFFQGELHSGEHFNTQEYWLSISREENLSLSRI
ncbi:retrotransposon ORF1 [Tanacetum coccineum]|uniref:Retrotransposon ORF1 n=1 Tax=Tanacetum coccineum TaxID=301880 RepID=A0ABQ5G325_9ASTR